jgi:CRP-like cAMP-binding protein
VAIADALMVRHAAARVAAMLLVMGSSGASPDSLPDPAFEVNQEDLARITNLSRSSLGRILADFAAEGLISFGYRQIRIADAAGLRRRRSEA